MTTKIFKARFEEEFYLRVRNRINTTLQFPSTDLISLGLFLHLPIKISLEKVTNIPQKSFSSGNETLVSFLQYFSAYTIVDSTKEIDIFVNFLFLYRNQKDLEYLYNSLESHTIREFLAFAYLHELQHILRRHTAKSTNSIYRGVVDSYLKKHNKRVENIDEFINIALDFAINYPLLGLMGEVKFKSVILYNRYYDISNMSELTIIKDLLDNLDNIDITQTQKKSSKIESFTTTIHRDEVYQDKSMDITVSTHRAKKDKLYSDNIQTDITIEDEISNLANILAEFITQRQRATKSQEVLQKLGGTIQVKSDWVKEILNSILAITRDITHQYISTWSSLKNQYRKIGLFPNKKFIQNRTLVYASIDQSGSMSNEELRRINYILTIIAKKVSYLHIIIHDSNIVKLFEFGKQSDSSYNIKLDKMLYNRYSKGGTSHSEVFEYLDKHIKSKEIPQSIYISFSDNYSDIEEIYNSYKVIRKIRKFWVTTGKSMNIAGRHILMR